MTMYCYKCSKEFTESDLAYDQESISSFGINIPKDMSEEHLMCEKCFETLQK